jgi:hypothetical protein
MVLWLVRALKDLILVAGGLDKWSMLLIPAGNFMSLQSVNICPMHIAVDRASVPQCQI